MKQSPGLSIMATLDYMKRKKSDRVMHRRTLDSCPTCVEQLGL